MGRLNESPQEFAAPLAAERQQRCPLSDVTLCHEECLKRFRAADVDGDDLLTPEELASCWAQMAEDRLFRSLEETEKTIVAANVELFFQSADVNQDGFISLSEWVHNSLLDMFPPGPATTAVISERLKDMGDIISMKELVRKWNELDTACTGLITRQQLLLTDEAPSDEEQQPIRDASQACLACGGVGCGMCSDRGPPVGKSQAERGKLDRTISPNADVVTYAQFCAYSLGLKYTRVELHYYDISKSLTKYLSPVLLGSSEEGIWHTGIVVWDAEMFYYGTINVQEPGTSEFGRPTKIVELGGTLRTRVEVDELLDELDEQFQPELYDVFTHNCNHLCDKLSLFLLGRHIPSQVRLLPERLMHTPVARLLHPILNKWLGCQGEVAADQEVAKTIAGGESGQSFSFRRSSQLHNMTKQLDRLGDELVAFQAPDCSFPVVARVFRSNEDGTSDLCWFDSAGNRQEHYAVRSADLMSFNSSSKGHTEAHRVYYAALEALDKADESGADTSGTSTIRSSLARSLSLTPSSITTSYATSHCPNQHELVAKSKSFWGGRIHDSNCDNCGSLIPRQDVRMCCDGCKYNVCRTCWQRTRPRASVGGLQLECREGHVMERLVGQARTQVICDDCKRENVAAISSFSFCCRLCDYDLCGNCGKKQAAAKCGQLLLASSLSPT